MIPLDGKIVSGEKRLMKRPILRTIPKDKRPGDILPGTLNKKWFCRNGNHNPSIDTTAKIIRLTFEAATQVLTHKIHSTFF
jgi:hypothetical protein